VFAPVLADLESLRRSSGRLAIAWDGLYETKLRDRDEKRLPSRLATRGGVLALACVLLLLG
jgi:hypothetical protein